MLSEPCALKAAILGMSDEFDRISENIAERRASHAVSHKAEKAELGHKRDFIWVKAD